MIIFFRGKSKPTEKTLIELYLALDIDEAFVQQCMQEAWKEKYWQVEPTLPSAIKNNEEAWQQFQIRSTPTKRKFILWKYAAVAILLLSIGISLTIYHKNSLRHANELAQNIHFKRYEAQLGKLTTLQLSDSSTVTLFPGSNLDLPSNFNDSDRQIRLSGRAYFQVSHNPKKPFYVSSGGLRTKVLGTSFEVNTNGNNQEQKVILHTGKIAIGFAKKMLAVLIPGQQLTLSKNGTYQVAKVDTKLLTSWAEEKLSYNQIPLKDICAELDQWYDVKIMIKNNSICNKRLTASFTRKPLNTVLDILAITGDFQYEMKGKSITIY